MKLFFLDSSQIGVVDTLVFTDFEFTEALTVELQKSISPKIFSVQNFHSFPFRYHMFYFHCL